MRFGIHTAFQQNPNRNPNPLPTQGRRFSLYVPEELVPQVQRWLDNGHALQELLYQAASRNLQALKLERDQASKKTED